MTEFHWCSPEKCKKIISSLKTNSNKISSSVSLMPLYFFTVSLLDVFFVFSKLNRNKHSKKRIKKKFDLLNQIFRTGNKLKLKIIYTVLCKRNELVLVFEHFSYVFIDIEKIVNRFRLWFFFSNFRVVYKIFLAFNIRFFMEIRR